MALTNGFTEYAREERRRVVDQLQRAEARMRELRGQLENLNGLLGNHAGDDTPVRGATLRVQITAALQRLGPGPHHYGAIYDEMRRGGVEVAGVDPLATVLTNLTRCHGVVRTSRGHYQLIVTAVA